MSQTGLSGGRFIHFLHWSIAAVALAAGCGQGGSQSADFKATAQEELSSAGQQHRHKRVCADAAPGHARCHSLVRVNDVTGQMEPFAAAPVAGSLTPADLASAYKLPATGGGGMTIAIVDAYDDPNAESDLAVYRAQFGLPPCTTANGCFRKVNQNGQTSPLPAADVGWAEETSLDLDMASAICPSCNILLVEATSATIGNLGTAVNRAVAMG